MIAIVFGRWCVIRAINSRDARVESNGDDANDAIEILIQCQINTLDIDNDECDECLLGIAPNKYVE